MGLSKGYEFRDVKPCGTTAAYRRHRRRNERPCEYCSRANRLARAEWRSRQDPAVMSERRQGWRVALKDVPVPTRKEHLFPLSALPVLGAERLARITGMSYSDAARYICNDLKLTLNQADRAAVALGQSLETLWPELTIRAA